MSHDDERGRKQSAALLFATVAAATLAALTATAHGWISPGVLDLVLVGTAVAGGGAGWGITR